MLRCVFFIYCPAYAFLSMRQHNKKQELKAVSSTTIHCVEARYFKKPAHILIFLKQCYKRKHHNTAPPFCLNTPILYIKREKKIFFMPRSEKKSDNPCQYQKKHVTLHAIKRYLNACCLSGVVRRGIAPDFFPDTVREKTNRR